jgi:Tol biopolymer transport system component
MRRQSILVAAIFYNWLPIGSVKEGRCKMKWFNDSKITLLVLAFVLALMVTGGSANGDFTFGEPVNLGSLINSLSGEALECISPDGLEMYLSSDRAGGQGQWDLWVAKRATRDADWDPPENLGPVINTAVGDELASIAADGLTLYFDSGRPGGYGSGDIWMTTRATKNDPWGPPVNMGPKINTSAEDACPRISTDGLELYFESGRSGGYGLADIWVARRATQNDPWGEPVNLGPVVNSSNQEIFLSLSPDGLLLLFSDQYSSPFRPGGYGSCDMWMSRRATISEPWQAPVNLGPKVNGPFVDGAPRISPDGCTLYFCSERPGGLGGPWGDIWEAPIIQGKRI